MIFEVLGGASLLVICWTFFIGNDVFNEFFVFFLNFISFISIKCINFIECLKNEA